MNPVRLLCLFVIASLSSLAGAIVAIFYVVAFGVRRHRERANQPSRKARRSYDAHLQRVEAELMRGGAR